MHKSATKCNKTIGKWCKNKHGASKIIDTFETYHFTGILYLILLLAVLAFLALELLFEEDIRGQRFLELLMQPLHHDSMALFHPLECGLQLGSICMAEIIAEY
jgi:hypothetical protein